MPSLSSILDAYAIAPQEPGPGRGKHDGPDNPRVRPTPTRADGLF